MRALVSPQSIVAVLGTGALGYAIISTIYDQHFALQGSITEEQIAEIRQHIADAKAGKLEHPLKVPASPHLQRTDLPKIVLVGERHDCEQCLDRVEEMRRQDEQGSIVFVEEGKLANSSQGDGIEEPRSRFLATTILGLNGPRNFKMFHAAFGRSFLVNLAGTGDWGKSHWRLLKRELQSRVMTNTSEDHKAELERALRVLDREIRALFAVSSTKERIERAKQIPDDVATKAVILPLLSLPAQVQELPKEFSERYPQVKALHGYDPMEVPLSRAPKEVLMAFMTIIHNIRDETMARGTLDVYAAEAARLNKPLYVRMGMAHVPGVYHYLRVSLDRAGLSHVPIEAHTDALEHWPLQRLRSYPYSKEAVEAINAYESERQRARRLPK